MVDNISAAELKRALSRWRVSPRKIAACVERQELVALYLAEKAQREESKKQQREQQRREQWQRTQQTPNNNTAASTMQTYGVIGFVLLFIFLQKSGFIGNQGHGNIDDAGPSDEVDFKLTDDAYVRGKVAEVVTFTEFTSALNYHKSGTGLPVVVDFFSHSCGPCIAIAPFYRRMAKTFKGRAVFLKVDVNRNRETSGRCGVRAMPTFQFYVDSKKVAEFSGADAHRLQAITEDLATKASKRGTFVSVSATAESLHKFFEKHDKSKVSQSAKFAEKYKRKTAKLMRSLKRKYGATPELVSDADQNRERDEDKKGDSRATDSTGDNDKDEEGAEDTEQEDEDDFYPFVQLPSEVATATNPAKVVILGGGPAGLTAAIYAARAGLDPIMISPSFGGQLLGKGVWVENFPGIVGNSATGRGIVRLMRQQALEFKTMMIDDVCSKVDLGGDQKGVPFRIELNATKDSRPLFTHTIIIATGADSKWLGVPGEHEYRGRGVSSCATCDGFLYRGKHVLVVGGGDTAMEDALVLARTSSKVTVVHRRDELRASYTLSQRVLSNEKINILWNTEVVRFGGKPSSSSEGEQNLSFAELKTKGEDGTRSLEIGAAFIAIGHSPNTDMFQSQLEMNSGSGYLSTEGHSTHTSKPGVFAAGDVADSVYRQAITSAGSGAMAALDAERYLSSLGITA